MLASRAALRAMTTQTRAMSSLNKVIFTSTCKSTGREGTVEAVGDSGSGLSLSLEKHTDHGGKGGASCERGLGRRWSVSGAQLVSLGAAFTGLAGGLRRG